MILTHRTSFPSAKLLRDALFTETGVRYLVTKHPNRIRRLHVRYGATSPVSCRDTEFNRPQFINLIANKLRFSDRIKNVFNTPIFYRHREPRDDEFPIVIRNLMQGFGGEGIVMCPDREAFDGAWNGRSNWTSFVKTTEEYRVHVLGGEIGRLFKKVRKPIDGVTPAEDDFPIRTGRTGDYRFSLRRNSNEFPELTELTSQLHDEIGGHIYALDVGRLPDDQGWFIFEANSAPGLNRNTATAYAKYLVEQGAMG